MTLKEAIEKEALKAEGEMRDDPEQWTGGYWWELGRAEELSL